MTSGSGGACSTPSARARVDEPVHRRTVESAAATLAVGPGDTREQLEIDLLREPPKRAVADRRLRLGEHARLQVMRHQAEDLAAHVVAVDRMHVEPIEQRRRRRDACLLVIERSDPAVDVRRRRGLAEIVADRAEHDRHLPRGRDRRCARGPGRRPSACAPRRRPPGCHSGSCGQPTSASSSGNSRSMTPSRARARGRGTAARQAGAASRSRPRPARPAGRRAGCQRHSASVAGSTCNSKRAANCSARSTRRLSSAKVSGIDGAEHARSRSSRPSKGSRYSPVSGSHEIALMVKSRRRAASCSGHRRIALHRESAVAAAGLRFAARQRHVESRRSCRR